jgi:hypothetical protein
LRHALARAESSNDLMSEVAYFFFGLGFFLRISISFSFNFSRNPFFFAISHNPQADN